MDGEDTCDSDVEPDDFHFVDYECPKPSQFKPFDLDIDTVDSITSALPTPTYSLIQRLG